MPLMGQRRAYANNLLRRMRIRNGTATPTDIATQRLVSALESGHVSQETLAGVQSVAAAAKLENTGLVPQGFTQKVDGLFPTTPASVVTGRNPTGPNPA